jgi:hypothetical protein
MFLSYTHPEVVDNLPVGHGIDLIVSYDGHNVLGTYVRTCTDIFKKRRDGRWINLSMFIEDECVWIESVDQYYKVPLDSPKIVYAIYTGL